MATIEPPFTDNEELPLELWFVIFEKLDDRFGLLREVHPTWKQFVDHFFQSNQSLIHVLMESKSLIQWTHKYPGIKINEASVIKALRKNPGNLLIAESLFPTSNLINLPICPISFSVLIEASLVGNLDVMKQYTTNMKKDFRFVSNEMRSDLFYTICIEAPPHILEWFNLNYLNFFPPSIAKSIAPKTLKQLFDSESNSLEKVQSKLDILFGFNGGHTIRNRETLLIFIKDYLKHDYPALFSDVYSLVLSFDQEIKPLMQEFKDFDSHWPIALLIFPHSSFVHQSDVYSQSLSEFQQSIKDHNLPLFVHELQKISQCGIFISSPIWYQIFRCVVQVGWRDGFDYLMKNFDSFRSIAACGTDLQHFPFFVDSKNIDTFASFLVHVLSQFDVDAQFDQYVFICLNLFQSDCVPSSLIVEFFSID